MHSEVVSHPLKHLFPERELLLCIVRLKQDPVIRRCSAFPDAGQQFEESVTKCGKQRSELTHCGPGFVGLQERVVRALVVAQVVDLFKFQGDDRLQVGSKVQEVIAPAGLGPDLLGQGAFALQAVDEIRWKFLGPAEVPPGFPEQGL